MAVSKGRRSLATVVGGISLTSATAILIGLGSVLLLDGARQDVILVLFSVTAVAGVAGGYLFGPQWGMAIPERHAADADHETLV